MKLGITLYSWNLEYFDRRYTLEDLVRKSSEIGYKTIELIAPSMLPDYPFPKEEFYDQWHSWMEKYNVEPSCLDIYNEYMVFKYRKMTDDEQYAQLLNDMKIANRMGMKVLRGMNLYTPAMFERALEDAEKLDVKLSLEVHGPKKIDDPAVYEYLAIADKYKTDRVGICPDLSTFQFTVPPRMLKFYVAKGASVEIADYIRRAYNTDVPYEEALDVCQKMGAKNVDMLMARNVYQGRKSDFNKLRELAPYVTHVHAKCFDELDENGNDPTFDCKQFIDIMKESKYKGSISVECEAFQYEPISYCFDSADILSQHYGMWNKLINA